MDEKIESSAKEEKEKPWFRPIHVAAKHSHVFVLPKDYIRDAGLESGDFLKVTQEGKRLILEKAD